MAKIEGSHVDDRVGAVPGPDSVNRHVSGSGTELDSVPGMDRLKWAGAIIISQQTPEKGPTWQRLLVSSERH